MPATTLDRSGRWSVVGALCVLLLAATYIRGEHLNRDSVWHDEAHSALISRPSPADLIRSAALEDNHPPLYYVLLHYWVTAVNGDDETRLRTPSVVFGVFGIIATFLMAQHLGGPRIGLWSAALLGVSSAHVAYSREARMYSLLFFLTAASMYAFVRLERGGWGRALVWILATAAMLLSHTVAVFVLAAQHLCWMFLWWRSRESPTCLVASPRRWIAMNAAVAVAVAPWAWIVVGQYRRFDDVFWIARPYLSAPLDILIALSGSTLMFGGLAIVALFGTLWLATRSAWPVPTVRWQPATVLGVLVIWAAAPLLIPWIWSYVGVPILIPRIAIPTLAPLTILAAFGIAAIRPRWLSAAAGALLIGAGGVQSWDSTHRLTKEDWRSAAALIKAAAEPGDLLLFHQASRRKGMDYYLGASIGDVAGFPARRFRAGETIEPSELDALTGIIRPYSRVWLFLANSRDPHGLIEQSLERAFVLRQSNEFRQIQVRLFTRDP